MKPTPPLHRILCAVLPLVVLASAHAEFRAGAAVVDVTPEKLPVLVNGGMLSRRLDRVKTRVQARAVALADARSQVVLVVVDSCLIDRALLDEAKGLAARRTGIPASRMLISATHTHSAPAVMGALGTDAEPSYRPFLRDRLVEAIAAAQANLEPARIGFAKAEAVGFAGVRRWVRRPDRLDVDPFGNPTVRATMHAATVWDNVIGEGSPSDPDLALISIQARNGRPLAVLGNFSFHYFGDQDISASYFGLFSEGLRQRLAPEASASRPAFVGLMSNGCSGDIGRRDYMVPAEEWAANQAKVTIDEYTDGLLEIAMKAYAGIRYREDVEVVMAERRLAMKYRVPDRQRLEWAQRVVAAMGDRLPKDRTEVYAREQLLLHEWQQTEVVVQALRIGEIGIATTPTETYAVTGLKIKAASPLPNTIVISLANGGDGYIPPPEHHLFGGYNTWAARTAGLEVAAEPRIAEAAIALLETVAGQPRRPYRLGQGPAAHAILALRPAAWWRLDEFTGPHAIDATGNHRDAHYEREITFYLEGPRSDVFALTGESNRAAHFVGGRLRARLADLGSRYSVSLWIWNGMPNEGRDVTGWFFSRGRDHGLGPHDDHFGIGGRSGHAGRLIFLPGTDPRQAVPGRSEIPRWQWQHIVLVRDGDTVRAYLNGTLELETHARADFPPGFDHAFFGGRSDNDSNWEGRLDEIAVFNRALSATEVTNLVVK